jgi:hypothetical protein
MWRKRFFEPFFSEEGAEESLGTQWVARLKDIVSIFASNHNI